MSRVCDVCGKRSLKGNKVSHANNKHAKVWQPNLQKIRCVDDKTGGVKQVRVCTRCIRSGFVKKVV